MWLILFTRREITRTHTHTHTHAPRSVHQIRHSLVPPVSHLTFLYWVWCDKDPYPLILLSSSSSPSPPLALALSGENILPTYLISTAWNSRVDCHQSQLVAMVIHLDTITIATPFRWALKLPSGRPHSDTHTHTHTHTHTLTAKHNKTMFPFSKDKLCYKLKQKQACFEVDSIMSRLNWRGLYWICFKMS